MKLKDIYQKYAEQIAESILALNSFNIEEIKATIVTHMKLYSRDIAKYNFKNAENSIAQYQEILNSPETSKEKKLEAAKKIKELTDLRNSSNILFTETSRENKYKTLRLFLKEKGLKDILTEFDYNNQSAEKLC